MSEVQKEEKRQYFVINHEKVKKCVKVQAIFHRDFVNK